MEQFALTSPHDDASWQEIDSMIGHAEEFYKSLGRHGLLTSFVCSPSTCVCARACERAWVFFSFLQHISKPLVSTDDVNLEYYFVFFSKLAVLVPVYNLCTSLLALWVVT